jgi:amidohydrolase
VSSGVGNVNLSDAVRAIEKKVIAWRRDFHIHPEIGLAEHRTSAKVKEHLDALGIPYKTYAGTGIVGLIDSGKPGPTILLRADMDALPVTEENDIPYCSQNEGMMHACGHDAHTAMLMGVAEILAKDGLAHGAVKLCFQPGEEGRDGAKLMIEDGMFKDEPRPDVAFGMHVWNNMPAGTATALDGGCMAGVHEFEIDVIGKGGHAAMPHQCIDPILIGSHIVTALQSIVSRNTNPHDKLVVSVCQFHAGTAFNIIPPNATLRGTARMFSPEVAAHVPDMINEIAEGVAKAMGGCIKMDYIVKLPPTINDARVAGFARVLLAEIIGEGNVKPDAEPSMGGEDFSLILNEIPGAYAFLGANNPNKDATMPHHHPQFNIDEDMLAVGVELAVRFVREWRSDVLV